MSTGRKWNLTPKRLESIASKELPENIKDEFLLLFGVKYWNRDHSLEQTFNRREWMTKDIKIEVLKTMCKVFKNLREYKEFKMIGPYNIFSIATCLNYPGSYEIFEKSPKRIQTEGGIFSHKHSRSPRTFNVYLQLLERVGFEDKYLSFNGETMPEYLKKSRKSSINHATQFGYDTDLSTELLEILIRRTCLTGFGSNTYTLMVLLNAIYGSQKLEEALTTFIKDDFHIHADDLLIVLDRWEELKGYPGHWIVELLGFENAARV